MKLLVDVTVTENSANNTVLLTFPGGAEVELTSEVFRSCAQVPAEVRPYVEIKTGAGLQPVVSINQK